MTKKTRTNYKVCVPNCKPVIVYNSPSPQNACRIAFRSLIKSGQLKRQPRSINGDFQGVEIWIL